MKHPGSRCSFRSNVMCISYGFNTRRQAVLMQEEKFCQRTAKFSSLEHINLKQIRHSANLNTDSVKLLKD